MCDEIAYVILLAVFMFVFGFFTGGDVTSESWRIDCEKVGKHLSSDKVYFCFPEGGK